MNLQYSQYIMKMSVAGKIIDHGTNVMMPYGNEKIEGVEQARHSFLALSGAPVKGFDTDRNIFLGTYRTYANPIVVEQGRCNNSIAVGDNACGVIQVDISLEPGESKELVVLMGIGKAAIEGKHAVHEMGNTEEGQRRI